MVRFLPCPIASTPKLMNLRSSSLFSLVLLPHLPTPSCPLPTRYRLLFLRLPRSTRRPWSNRRQKCQMAEQDRDLPSRIATLPSLLGQQAASNSGHARRGQSGEEVVVSLLPFPFASACSISLSELSLTRSLCLCREGTIPSTSSTTSTSTPLLPSPITTRSSISKRRARPTR
jgi:hypothetical protein